MASACPRRNFFKGWLRSRQTAAADEPWEEVAKFAAYSAQIEGLGLMPWQNPPIYAHSPISKSRLTIRAANARPPRF